MIMENNNPMPKNNRHTWLMRVSLIFVVIGTVAGATFAIDEVTPTPTPDPDVNVEALLDDAVRALQNGDPQAALPLLAEAIEADSGNAEAHALQGLALTTLDEFDEAIASFNQAVRLVPYEPIYLTLRADTYILMREWANALADYTAVIRLNPRNSEAFLGRAQAYDELGDANAAEIDALVADCIANWRFGDSNGALQSCDAAVNTGAASDAVAAAYYLRGIIQMGRDDLDTAIADYTSAIEVQPDMHDAFLGRGIAARMVDDLALAGRDFVRRMEIIERERFVQQIDYGDAVRVEMDYGYTYAIEFEAEADQAITISARGETEFSVDPLIALLDPEGTPIAGDDDFGGGLDAELNQFSLPVTGTYTLLVGHANGGYVGTVQVIFGAENTAMAGD